ncbi:globin domain-containing protein [Methylophaga muralis]|uniref:Bacterial hemoglobin n=1 Tax=Methylophaga muralis TaxID=291169 RepID=A0A1E3GPU1_9GAMM|nr:globin domain-containing protein [Methylophaga muralis]ODN66059.1 Bacterial hemoglobin [Methylophaga muralis]
MTENALRHYQLNETAKLQEQDIALVEQNFAVLMEFSDALAERFYQRLFTEYPEIMPLFKSVTIEGQHKKLLASMVLLIQHLRDTEMIEDYLQGLGARHQQYGVETSHFEMFIENWLSVVAEFADQKWDSKLQQAWRNVLEYVAELMQSPTLHPVEPDIDYPPNKNATPEHVLTSLAVAQTATPMLIIDSQLVIRYLNAAAESLFTAHQDNIEKMFPKVKIDSLIGYQIQHVMDKLPFPSDVFSNFNQLPCSIDLHNAIIDLRLTISVLYQKDDAVGFLLECYPQAASTNNKLSSATVSTTATDHSSTALPVLEKALLEVQQHNIHLTSMLQEIDDAVFEASLLALNCSVEAAKLGEEARQLRDFSMEIRILNQQLSQLLQPLKIHSGQQQQQLKNSLDLVQQLQRDLLQNQHLHQTQSHYSIEQISQQLARQTDALTQLINVISAKPSS